MKKRLFSLLLAVAMLLGLLPAAAFADSANIISEVEIWGLDMPIVGETPDYEGVLIGNPNYTITAPENSSVFTNGISWYDMTDDHTMQENEVFQADHEYRLTVSLKANDGYSFDAVENVQASVNLHETACALSFYGIDASQYITVNLGTASDFVDLTPLHRSTITTQNCIAYNAAGEQITSALEGETVTVRGATSIFGQTFNGWILNPANLQVTHDGVQQMHFVMPAEPVSIIGSYEDYMLTTVRLFFDDCVAGNEVDFTASNMSGSMMYPGYHCMTPEGHENVFYNGVAWWDDTDGRYLHPGDVYEANHVYQISAIIAADNGYVFDSRENLMVYTYPGGQCTVEELYISALDSTKHKFVTSGDIIPMAPQPINLFGGKAYDQYGNEISEALPGETVTLVADEPTFGWKFDQWTVMGNAEVDFDDVTATTTTFIMPNEGVTIMTGYIEAEKVPVQSISFTLKGYYMNTNANCLQVGVSEGAQFVTNYVSGLDYIVLADNAGTATDTQVTGALRNTAKHWIGVKVEPQFGYTLEGLTVSNISASFAEKILMNTDADGNMNVLMLVTYPARPLIKNNITITNGSAYINDIAITSTVPGMRVRIEADETSTNQTFYRWQVVSGGVELENPYDPVTYFTMGTAAVELEPVYYSYIDHIEVEISAPVAGTTPSYYKSILTENVMSDSTGDSYSRNGMTWYDVDTEEILDPNTAVFEVGHSYGVQIQLMTEPGAYFTLDETGYPAVTGCVNGVTDGVYVDQYTQNPQTQVMLQTSFYIAEDAQVAAPVSEVSITELEMPVAGELFGYNFSYDYLDDICGNVDSDDADTLNGITWIDITDPNNPVSMTPGVSLAEEGHMYRVEIVMSTTNSKIFALDESGLPSAIAGSINGESCDVALVGGAVPTRTIKLVYSVYAQEKFSLIVVGGLALVDGNYVAEADILPGTEIMLLPETSEDQVFSYWYVEVEGVHRLVYEANLIFDMPAGDTIVQAGYTFPHTHNTEPVEEKMSTCTENGWLRHYYCADCGRYSLDGTYTDYVDYTAHIELPLADHYVGAVEYSEAGHYGVCGYGCGLILTDVIPHEIVMHHDDLQHWGSCECGYEDTTLRAEHTWPSGGCGEVHCDCGATTILAHDYLDGICANCLQSLAEAIDLNDDGKVTAFDAQYLAEANAGLRELTEAQKIALGNLGAQDIINYILGRFDGA